MFRRSGGKIDLPSVSPALARIIQITNSPDASAEQVAEVVMLDQSLATKVLRIANSAYYSRRVKAETITEAVVTLGFSSIRHLAASASVIDALFPKQMFPGFDWREMWSHSVTCAVGTEVIYARMSRMQGAESAFVAGLLHDVGKLIIARALPQRFLQVVDACREYNRPMELEEQALLSTNHAKIGGDLARSWQFPESLIEAILYHHSPEDSPKYEALARAVGAANMLAKRMSRSYLIGISNDISLEEITEHVGMSVEELEHITMVVRRRMGHCGDILAWGDAMPKAKRAA